MNKSSKWNHWTNNVCYTQIQ